MFINFVSHKIKHQDIIYKVIAMDVEKTICGISEIKEDDTKIPNNVPQNTVYGEKENKKSKIKTAEAMQIWLLCANKKHGYKWLQVKDVTYLY